MRKLTAAFVGLFQMGVWAFQARDMNAPDLSVSPAGVYFAYRMALRFHRTRWRELAPFYGPRGRNSAMFASLMYIYCTPLINHLCLVFLTANDCTLNNHLLDVPIVSGKQESFQPPLQVPFGAVILFKIITPHGRVS